MYSKKSIPLHCQKIRNNIKTKNNGYSTNVDKGFESESPQGVVRDIQLLRAQKSKIHQKRNLST